MSRPTAPRIGIRHPRAAAPLVVLLGAFACVLSVPPANAGTFVVYACDSTAGSQNNTWHEVSTADLAQVASHSVCPAGSPNPYDAASQHTGVGVLDRLDVVTDTAPDGKFIERRFTAPNGTTIVRAVITRDVGNGDYWTPYAQIGGSDQAGESCQPAVGEDFCQIQGTRDFAPLSASRIAYGIRCEYAPWCFNGATLHEVWALVLRSQVTLDDTVSPTVATPTATGLADGAWHRLPGAITFAASDNTGIRGRRIVSGSTTVGTATALNAASGGCGGSTGIAYSYTEPCAGSRGLNGAQSVTVNPCVLGTGTHAVKAAATDTGGLETVSNGSVTIKADCAAPAVLVDAGAAIRTEGQPLEPTVAANDPDSGVASTESQYRVGLQEWQAYTAPLTVIPGATYRFRARATDAVGNTSAWAESDTVVGTLASPPPGTDEEDAGPEATPERPVASGLDTTLTPPLDDALLGTSTTQPRLSLTRATRSRRAVRVSGSTTGVTRITVAVRIRLRGRTTTLRCSLRVRDGRWTATLKVPAGLRHARVVRVDVTAPAGLHARLKMR